MEIKKNMQDMSGLAMRIKDFMEKKLTYETLNHLNEGPKLIHQA